MVLFYSPTRCGGAPLQAVFPLVRSFLPTPLASLSLGPAPEEDGHFRELAAFVSETEVSTLKQTNKNL